MVRGRVPSRVVAEVVQRYGISFEPTGEVLDEFRKAGADDVVMMAMQASWRPEWTRLLSAKDILVLVEHMPTEKIVDMVQRCGIGFQPTKEYLQGLRSTGAKDELIDALGASATKPFSRDNLFQLVASGGHTAQIGKGMQERGIDFAPTEEDLNMLRAAGASESLLQAIREAKRVNPGGNQLPNAPGSIWPGPTGTSATRAPVGARAICPPSMPSISVLARPSDMNATLEELGCGDQVRILEKDSGRVGIDKILAHGWMVGFVQDFYLSGSIGPGHFTPPAPSYKPNPPYSPQARRDKIQGTISLWFDIDSQGNVTDAGEVSKPLGEGLDEKAIETVKTWKFKPAICDGVPVPYRVHAEITFRLFR
jgi:TonB family protein